MNSYKRLVPGFEAPVYIAWSQRNRSALVRVPLYKPGKELATRAELRCPDPACNPYLAFAVMLAAGLKGIEEGYELPTEMTENLYELTEEERKEKGIESLPGSLGEAIAATENERACSRDPRRPRIRALHLEQEERVGPVPNPGHAVRAREAAADPVVGSADAYASREVSEASLTSLLCGGSFGHYRT